MLPCLMLCVNIIFFVSITQKTGKQHVHVCCVATCCLRANVDCQPVSVRYSCHVVGVISTSDLHCLPNMSPVYSTCSTHTRDARRIKELTATQPGAFSEAILRPGSSEVIRTALVRSSVRSTYSNHAGFGDAMRFESQVCHH